MTAALIPRSVFFDAGHPVPTLSPDGTRVGFIRRVDGVPNIWIAPVEDTAAAVPVTRDRRRGIQGWRFCHDSETIVYVQDTDGDENWRLYALHVPTGETRTLTPGTGIRATLLHYDRNTPTSMVVGLLDFDRRLVDPYRLDVTTGDLDKLATNPGYRAWLFDPDARIRGGVRPTAGGGHDIYLRDPDSGADELWMSIAPEDAATAGLPLFGRDDAVYMSSALGAPTRRLMHVDPATREMTVLAAHDDFDLTHVYTDPRTGRPQSAVFLGDRKIWHHLDPEFGATIDSLNNRLHGDISISRPGGSDTQWLVAETSDRAPTRYYRYTTSTDELTALYSDPAPTKHTFATMEPFTFTARDGLTIRGYITFPPGAARAELPAVLLVHGGPVLRDTWDFHPTAQWLASRGYAVVQINFRGSAGFGKAFVNAGDREWGRGIHNDLIDAVAHVVDQGWVDPKRVAIYGGSFGGYAALCGAAFASDVFCAAVDICGPSNLLTLLANTSAQSQAALAYAHRQIGHPEDDRDMLWEQSPLSRAADIAIPVLIVQGRNDPRVPIDEAEQIVAALTAAGIKHEYLMFPDEGHGVTRPQNVERLRDTIEAFLAAHLGGTADHESASSAAR